MKQALAFNAVALFFLSFLMSANGNVLPQLFFQRTYPEQKVFLLSLALLLSTVASTAGVFFARRTLMGAATGVLGLLATTGAMALLLTTQGREAYIALLLLIQFGDNYLLNQLDRAATAFAGEAQRKLHDVLGNVARLLGMLVGPAFFTLAYGRSSLLTGTVVALGLLASLGAWMLLAGRRREAEATQEAAPVPLEARDRRLFYYAASVYASLYLFAGNLIYLLRDVLTIPEAETRGGLTIVAVFASALLVNALAGVWRRSPSVAGRLNWLLLGLPAAILFVCAGLLAIGVRVPYSSFLTISCLVGASYGGFLLELRGYTSLGARAGKAALLTWFNNMANVSALIAFGLMFLLAAAGAKGDYFWTLCLIAGLPAMGALFLVAVARTRPA